MADRFLAVAHRTLRDLELRGRPFAEPTLLAMAAGYEAHTSHRALPPLTPPLK